MAQLVHRHMKTEYKFLCDKYETASYFAPLVKDRYRYKGTELLHDVIKNLKNNNNYTELIDQYQPECVIINNCGYGEMPLLMALVHPEIKVVGIEADEEKLTVAKYAAEGIVSNLEFKISIDLSTIQNIKFYDLSK